MRLCAHLNIKVCSCLNLGNRFLESLKCTLLSFFPLKSFIFVRQLHERSCNIAEVRNKVSDILYYPKKTSQLWCVVGRICIYNSFDFFWRWLNSTFREDVAKWCCLDLSSTWIVIRLFHLNSHQIIVYVDMFTCLHVCLELFLCYIFC